MRFSRLALGVLALSTAACSIPSNSEYVNRPDTPDGPTPGRTTLQITDPTIRTVQLFESSQEASLPVLALGSAQTLTLAFDWLTDAPPGPLEVSFRHVGLEGQSTLLPTETLTGFERDEIRDYRRSGPTAVPYIHYRYRFPNARIGFQVSGNYVATVRDPGSGAVLFSVPFFVAEQSAEVDLAFGTTLLDGAIGNAIQPAARLRLGPQLEGTDAFQYTVCFVRDGRLDDVRCAPEPRLVDLALFQFYLPRRAAFAPSPPLFELDLGQLRTTTEIVEVDRSARPPTALLDLDVAAFGGEVGDAVLATTPLVRGAFDDPGDPDTDAEYVAVRFRYVPPDEQQAPGAVRLVGSFSGWAPGPDAELTWVADQSRYEGTLLLKQGFYLYGYTLPDISRRTVIAVGQPSIFTAFVYLRDEQLFTERLVAVQSGIAR